MRWSLVFGGVLCVLAMEPAGVHLVAGKASAQQVPTFSTFVLFKTPDSVEMDPDVLSKLADAIRKAKAPGNCPLGKLRVRVPEGDQLFQDALLYARRDAVLRGLQELGVPVAGRLFVETARFGGPDGPDTVYDEPLRDVTKPTLQTTSQPQKGSKVWTGDQIVVTMVARDDSDQWQRGIALIQLTAESEGGRNVAPTPVSYAPCSDPREKRVVATYTVPPNPPPIVRLKALAKDHAGLEDTDIGEFPTADWYGTITSHAKGNIYHDTASIDFAFSIAPDGTISGRGRARVGNLPQSGTDCTYTRATSPAEFPVEIKVKRDFLGNEFEITPSKVGTSRWVHTYKGVCNKLGSRTEPGYTSPYNALANFRAVGGIRVPAQDGATNKPLPHKEADWVWTDEIVIHRVRE